jgi:TonB family protein
MTRDLRVSPLLAAVVFALWSFVLPAAAGAAEAPAALGFPTHFLLFTGSPEPSSEETSGVLMVPGTVIPVTADGPGRGDGKAGVAATLASGRSTTDLADRLRATLRLATIEVQYVESKILEIDAPATLPPATPGSGVRPEVTLLGLTDQLATYRVVFRNGDEQLSNTSVTVPLGRRSVVGALDGPAAPYLFLVVEPPGKRPLTVSDETRVSPPRRISGPVPEYPEDARKEHVEGTVVIQAVIAEDGTISQTRVLHSLTPSLDRVSEESIRQWTFEPATLDGEPVSVFYNLTINFRLDRDEKVDKGDGEGGA